MKNIDFEKRHDEIIENLKAADKVAWKHNRCEYRVYIDSNGDVGREEWVAGDQGYYAFADGYSRYYIATFCHRFESAFDCIDTEEMKKEVEKKFGAVDWGRKDEDGFTIEECSNDIIDVCRTAATDMDILSGDFEAWLDAFEDCIINELIEDEDYYEELLKLYIHQIEELRQWEECCGG